jgi:hypothetical protein
MFGQLSEKTGLRPAKLLNGSTIHSIDYLLLFYFSLWVDDKFSRAVALPEFPANIGKKNFVRAAGRQIKNHNVFKIC